MTKSATINIRLPREVVRLLDGMVARGLYASRSEAIRDFCREYLEERG